MSDADALAAFVAARLDEDEQVARTAGWHGRDDLSEWEYAAQPWVGAMRIQTVALHGTPGYEAPVGITCDYEGLSDSVDEDAGPHIARHDPASVLRRVKAQRAVLAALDDVGGHSAQREDAYRALAAVWRQHRDYRKEWDQ